MKKSKKVILIILSVLLIIVAGIYVFFEFIKDDKVEVILSEDEELISKVLLDENYKPKYIRGDYVSTNIEEKEDIFDLLNEIKALYGYKNAKDVFRIESVNTSENITYYKVQQIYDYIDVYGNQLIVSVKDNKVVNIIGTYQQINDFKTYKYQKVEKIKEIVASKYPDCESANDKKYVYVDENNTPHLVYEFYVLNDLDFYLLLVDANTGDILSTENAASFASEKYTGKGLDGNEHEVIVEKGLLGEVSFVNQDKKIKIYDGTTLTTPGLILDTQTRSKLKLLLSPYELVPNFSFYFDENNNLAYHCPIEKVGCDSDNEVAAYVTAMSEFEKIYDYYVNKFNWKSYDGKESVIKIIVNAFGYPSRYSNDAYLNASFMKDANVFIIGFNADYKSYLYQPFVLAHEYTHGVSNGIVNLKKEYESGALDEAYSDIMGFVISGDTEFDSGLGGGRSIANPAKFKNPIAKGDAYYENDADCSELNSDNDYCYIHKRSTVPSHAAYELYNRKIVSSLDDLGKIYFNSLYALTSNADFEMHAYAVLDTMKNLGYDAAAIEAATQVFKEANIFSDGFMINGKVVDNDGDSIEQAKVYLTNKNNENLVYNVKTDENGLFKFTNILPGEYIINVDMSYYDSTTQELNVTGDKKDLNITLVKKSDSNNTLKSYLYVMDRSLSMESTDPGNIRKQIISNLISVQENDSYCTLISFTTEASSHGKSNTRLSKKRMMSMVFDIPVDSGNTPVSGTYIASGLNEALEVIESNLDIVRNNYIILLTDGQDNVIKNKYSYDDLIQKAKDLNVKIITIGLSEEVEDDLLKKMASETGGKYFYADDSTDLSKLDKLIYQEIN